MNKEQKQMISRAQEYADLWALLFPPEVPTPSQRQFLLWLANYSEFIVKRSILRAAGKFEIGGLQLADVARYASGTMRNLRDGIEQKQVQQAGGAA